VKPRLLDSFCGGGGAAMGYSRAGFLPYGIDNRPQPHYPFPFLQMDALEAMDRLLRGEGLTFSNGETLYLLDFIAYHASPPCQRYSTCTPMRYRNNHPDLIADVRSLLKTTNKPYVIENVENARHYLINPFKLCGTMFGLNLRRHRYFETYPEMYPLFTPCDHSREIVYVSGSTGCSTSKFHRKDFTVQERRQAMAISWMIDKELDQAIPPAYTEYIGKYLLAEGEPGLK